MKLVKGVWLPDNDTHFEKWMNNKGYYQSTKFDEANLIAKKHKVFVDIGAHVGLWSRMARDAGFKKIIAFEALPEHTECYLKNLEGMDATIHTVVLGNDEMIDIIPSTDGNTGGTSTKKGTSKVYRLDDFNIPRIDLMKIDVQGMEREVLEGAVETIIRCKPTIIVEQKQDKRALEYLENIGMKRIKKIVGDYIYDF